jgi:hypothetical protein
MLFVYSRAPIKHYKRATTVFLSILQIKIINNTGKKIPFSPFLQIFKRKERQARASHQQSLMFRVGVIVNLIIDVNIDKLHRYNF